jgi:hypothetical protein
MSRWPELRRQNFLLKIFMDKTIVNYFVHDFDKVFSGKLDTWDLQWFFTSLKNSGLVATPNKNLVSNIGWVGTHTEGVTPKTGPITISSAINLDALRKKEAVLNKLFLDRQLAHIGATKFSWRSYIKSLLFFWLFLIKK